MEFNFDWALDICFLICGLISLIVVSVCWKRFDLWLAVPVCIAWICKGIRALYYDCFINTMKNTGEVSNMHAQVRHVTAIAPLMDGVITVLLIAALICLFVKWLYRRWYKKAIRLQSNEKGRG